MKANSLKFDASTYATSFRILSRNHLNIKTNKYFKDPNNFESNPQILFSNLQKSFLLQQNFRFPFSSPARRRPNFLPLRRFIPTEISSFSKRRFLRESGVEKLISGNGCPDVGAATRESVQDPSSVEGSSVDEPPSPEGRLQPEDLSVTTKSKEAKDAINTTDALPPLKTPELKLSVRKLLGCSPSPPPISRDRSASPESCIELKNHTSNDAKSSDLKIQSQVSKSLMQEEGGKGKGIIY